MTMQVWFVVVLAAGWLTAAVVARLWWHQAQHDRLTGLANRVRLEALARRARWRRGSVGVLLLDVDRFKRINDSFGHRAGDALLAAIAVRLRAANVRREVAIRLHGDEFAVWLGGIDAAVTARRADEVAEALARPVRIGRCATELVVTASVGYATGPAADLPGLLHAADQRMYETKRRRAAVSALPGAAPGPRLRDRGRGVA